MTTKQAKAKKKPTSQQTARSKRKGTSSENDIIELILKDHKPLKALIKVMKDDDKDFDERKGALKEFVPLLLEHAKSEAKVLYTFLKGDEELREEGFEGDVEHNLAELMTKETKKAADEDLLSAEIKVLAELVEHHIEEEEEELLPDFKKASEAEVRCRMGEEYVAKKQEFAGEIEDFPQGSKVHEQAHAQH